MRLGLGFSGFVMGGLVGGFAHMLLLFDAALDALERSGTSPSYFTGKPVGEAFFFRTYLYAVGLLTILLILACFAVVKLLGAIGRWRRGAQIWSSRPSLAALVIPIAGAALGALCAATANLRVIAGEYAAQLTIEEHFAITSASAVPEMHVLTNVYVGIILIALCIGVVVSWGVRARPRRV